MSKKSRVFYVITFLSISYDAEPMTGYAVCSQRIWKDEKKTQL